MTRKLSPSYERLPKLVRTIQRNQTMADAHLRRLAFVKLVYVSSGGPGGDAPTDNYGDQVLQDELDAAIDDLQELLDKQQQQLAGLNGGDGPAGGGKGDPTDQPCQEDLLLYQAALKANDAAKMDKYLTAYSNCVRIHSAAPKPKK